MKTTYDYRPVLFFVMAYALTWIIWSLGVYVGSQPRYESYAGLFSLIGLVGPIGTALFLVLASRCAALKKDFKDRLFNLRRVRPVFALIAVVVPFIVIGLSITLSLWLGQSADQFRFSGGSNLLPMIILAVLLAPICEETGWHGYGVDSLRAKAGMMKATLLFAALWCGWHAPLVLVSVTYQHELAMMDNKIFVVNFFVSIVPAAIIANWFYYKNDRSVAASILLHSMLKQTPDSFAAVFDTNVLGTLLGLKHEMRVMAKQGGGSIVNLSSVLGKVGAPNAAVYTASKHAVEGLTKAAALEGAAIGVRVNAVAPGPVETEMLNRFTGGGERKENFLESVPVKRAATPQEIADTILFLACKAPFLTGQSIVVDGGKTAA